MKNWVLGTFLGLALSCQVIAQDCCPISCDPCSSIFHGLYLGGNFGFAMYRADRADLHLYQFDGNRSAKNTKWEAGVQTGYDWLCNNWLFGVVGDWQWTNAHMKPNFTIGANIFNIKEELRWISTFRGRTGFAFNRALLYLTAGAAFAKLNTEYDLTLGPTRELNAFKKYKWGLTGGVGAEFAVWRQLSLQAEVLYTRFSSYQSEFFSPLRNRRIVFKASDEVWLGRLGVNYRFAL